jgi:hypothetical protein
MDRMNRLEAVGVATREVFSKLCREFRASSKACDEACENCDKQIVLKYYRGVWNGPKLYRCHLGLWDMAYPLRVKQRLVGVLFGGQLIMLSKVHDWDKAFSPLRDEAELDPLREDIGSSLPLTEEHSEDVRAAILRRTELAQNVKDRLILIAREEAERANIGVDGLLMRYREFKDFASSIGEVLTDLWKLRSDAARGQHVHECCKDITRKGDELSTKSEVFWYTLDGIVAKTLPGVKGYVLYRHDRHKNAYIPERTWVYDDQTIADHMTFRKACRWVLDRVREDHQGPDFVSYDLVGTMTPASLGGLVQRSLVENVRFDGWAHMVGFPLYKGPSHIDGGLICLCARSERLEPWEGDYAGEFSRFYAEALRDITSVLSMVFARHDAEEAQAAAWAVRSHELVAPIHAVKGYQDNLKYAFEVYVEPLLSVKDEEVKAVFRARLSRLEGLCALQELIATAVTLEDASNEKARLVDFRNDVLLPIVQPLRDFAQHEKQVPVYFRPDISIIPNMYMCINQMKRCVFNLLMNAVKYSDDGSEVQIYPKIMKSHYEIHVANRGIGVPTGEEDDIFSRFVQGSNSGESGLSPESSAIDDVRISL